MDVTALLSDKQQTAPVPRRPSARKQTGGLHVRLALDRKTKRDAYRLRHAAYLSKEYIDARSGGEFSDPFDRLERNSTLVVYERDVAVGSVRVCQSGPGQDLPVAAVFPSEITRLVEAAASQRPERHATELNRLVRHPSHANNSGLVFILFRMATFIIRQNPPLFLASCVRTNHAGFYKRLRFEHVAGPKAYTDLHFPTNLLVCPRPSLELISRTIPMLASDEAEDARYSRMFDGDMVPVFDHG